MKIDQSTSPIVTVVVSCFNHQRYIEETLLSVLNQTYKNIELLVFDDGSTDDSVSIIAALSKIHSFSFYPQANLGLSTTLDNALILSKGKYFVPFGSDDVMFLDRIEKQVQYMEDHPSSGVCGGNIIKIDELGYGLTRQKSHPASVNDFYDIFLNTGIGLPAPTLFFLSSSLKAVGGFSNEIQLEDLYIQLKLTQAGFTADGLNDMLAYYRIHPDNNYKKLSTMFENVLLTYAHFKEDPSYEKVIYAYHNKMLLRAAGPDKKLAWRIFCAIPYRHFNLKTLKGIRRFFCKGHFTKKS